MSDDNPKKLSPKNLAFFETTMRAVKVELIAALSAHPPYSEYGEEIVCKLTLYYSTDSQRRWKMAPGDEPDTEGEDVYLHITSTLAVTKDRD